MIQKNENISIWVDNYSLALLSRTIYLIGSQEEAEDIVQEVFLAAFDAYDSFKNDSNPKTWLMSILNNKVADYYRKKYKETNKIKLDSFFDETGSWKQDSVLSDWGDNLDDDTSLGLTLENCIEKLPPKWMIPVKLYYLEEKKTDSVCQVTGITTTNLWKILQRSRLQLRECLEINWYNQL